MSNSRFLSTAFIVPMIRQLAGHPDRVGVLGRVDPVRHDAHRYHLAGSPVGQHHRRAGQHREELAERTVEVRPVHLVDHQPLAALDRLDEQSGPEDQTFRSRLESADGLEGRPLRGGGGRLVAGAQHGVPPELGGQVRQGRLPGAGRPGEDHVLAGIEWPRPTGPRRGRGRSSPVPRLSRDSSGAVKALTTVPSAPGRLA